MILFGNRFIPKEHLRISPDDRGYYFGDGIYEVIRVYEGRFYEMAAHMNRLQRSAREARIPLPYSTAELERLLEQLVHKNGLVTGTVYVQITRGEAPRAHAFPGDARPVVYGYCNEVPRPHRMMERGIRAITLEDVRWLRCDIKSLNLLGNVLAKQEALDRGADEAILHRGGTVTECSASNVMMFKDGKIFTHPANHLILHGVTRAVTLNLARRLGMEIDETPFHVDELKRADEVWITGTTVEITPVVQVDGQPVGDGRPGPVVRKLQQAFERTIWQ
jgi:D-alanine transaminase